MNRSRLVECVDRIVDPVRAGEKRKDRMREELAAHLSASHAEELARLGDDEAAVERAIARLGDPAELTRGLQAVVPLLERWACAPVPWLGLLDALDRVLRRRPDETPLRHAVRVTTGFVVVIAAAELVLLSAVAKLGVRPRSDSTISLVWAVGSLAVVAVGGVVLPLFVGPMMRAMDGPRRSRRRLALLSASSSLVVIALGFGFAAIVWLGGPGAGSFDRTAALRLAVGSLVAPAALIAGAREAILRRRRRDGWEIAQPAR